MAETATGGTATVDVATTFAPGPVVDVEGPTTVVVTNTYTPAAGRLVVTKVVTGDGAGLRGPVTIDVVCDGTAAGHGHLRAERRPDAVGGRPAAGGGVVHRHGDR